MTGYDQINNNVIHGTTASLGKDQLMVEERPKTRSRLKMVKEVIRLIAQTTVDKTLIITIKGTNFMLVSEKKNSMDRLNSSHGRRECEITLYDRIVQRDMRSHAWRQKI